MEIKTVFVAGAGQMGSGIAQVHAMAGLDVYLYDLKNEIIERALANIQKNLRRQVEKGRLTEEETGQILARLHATTDLGDAKNADLVIEAVVENMEVKKDLFRKLDEIAPSQAILATNTSSLSITEIASATNRPEKVIGMHFMNPVPVMKLVEIIRGLQTADETYAVIEQMTHRLNKTPVEVNDFPGFVSNRILLPMINEAIYAVYEGVAAPEADRKSVV